MSRVRGSLAGPGDRPSLCAPFIMKRSHEAAPGAPARQRGSSVRGLRGGTVGRFRPPASPLRSQMPSAAAPSPSAVAASNSASVRPSSFTRNGEARRYSTRPEQPAATLSRFFVEDECALTVSTRQFPFHRFGDKRCCRTHDRGRLARRAGQVLGPLNFVAVHYDVSAGSGLHRPFCSHRDRRRPQAVARDRDVYSARNAVIRAERSDPASMPKCVHGSMRA